MKEYEYIAYGIENYLVDELVEVICQENLESKPYPDGFRRIFDNYRKLRKDFQNITTRLGVSNLPESELDSVMTDFSEKQKHFLETFLKDMESNYPDLDVQKIADSYLNRIRSEDVITTEKRVSIYPHIVMQSRL